MKTLKNKVAVITGGSRGIGLALAKLFAQQGCRVVITGRDPRRLKQTAGLWKGSKAEITALPCDTGDAAQVEKLFKAVGKLSPSIDILVNNAGLAHALAPVDQLPVEVWKELINTNLTGMFLISRSALPLMSAGGTIVNNLSLAAVHTFAGMAAYNASNREKMISPETVAQAVLHALTIPSKASIEEIRIGPAAGVL